jgi:type II secretory pathway pseudopilin PulG
MKHAKQFSTFKIFSSRFKGQSLIEITVALGALTTLLTISAIAIITALSNSQESKNQNQASTYAQQGIEILRQMRDTSWSSFDSLSGTYCMDRTCSQLTSSGICGPKSGSCGQNVDMYSREVTLQKNDPQCSVGGNSATRALVSVAWTDSKCTGGSTFCRLVKIETCFSNIYGDSGL